MTTRALVICPSLARDTNDALRSPEARREEAVGLAQAIDLKVVGAESVSPTRSGRRPLSARAKSSCSFPG